MTVSLQMLNTDMELLRPVMSAQAGGHNDLQNTGKCDHTSFAEILDHRSAAGKDAVQEEFASRVNQNPAHPKRVGQDKGVEKTAGAGKEKSSHSLTIEDPSRETDSDTPTTSADAMNLQAVACIDPSLPGAGENLSTVLPADQKDASKRLPAATEAILSESRTGSLKDVTARKGILLPIDDHSGMDSNITGTGIESTPVMQDGPVSHTPLLTEAASAMQSEWIAPVPKTEPLNRQGITTDGKAFHIADQTHPGAQAASKASCNINDSEMIDTPEDSSGATAKKPQITLNTNSAIDTPVDPKSPSTDGKSVNAVDLLTHNNAFNKEQIPDDNPDKNILQNGIAAVHGNMQVDGKEDIIDEKRQRLGISTNEIRDSLEKNPGRDGITERTTSQKNIDGLQQGAFPPAFTNKPAEPSTANATKKRAAVKEGEADKAGIETSPDTASQQIPGDSAFKVIGSKEDHSFKGFTSDAEKDVLKTTAAKARNSERTANPPLMESLNSFSSFSEKMAVAADNASGLNAESIIDQITDAKQYINRDMNRIKITLTPPNLGTVDLEVVVRKNRVEVVMTADHSGVQQILQSHVEDIKSALQKQDMNIDSFQVFLQNNSDGNQQQTNQWAAMYDHGKGRNTPYTDTEESPDLSAVSPGNYSMEHNSGLVSVFA